MEFLPAINLAMESIISQIVQSLKYLGAVFTLWKWKFLMPEYNIDNGTWPLKADNKKQST